MFFLLYRIEDVFNNLSQVLAKQPPRAAFPSPSGGAAPSETAAFSGGEKKSGAYSAPNGLKNFRRSMRIPNMSLVLKFDNGKVVSIANEQTESHSHPVPYYNIDDIRS